MADLIQDNRFKAIINDLTWYRTNVPCMEACPVHTDSGRYVQLIQDGKDLDSFLISRSSNPLASICGRICAAPCEDACRRGWIDEAVSIRPLKRYVTEQFGAESSNPNSYELLNMDKSDLGCSRLWHLSNLSKKRLDNSSRKIAIIGSGPSGLACAHDLALMGYSVTIFEALEHAGGMLRYGIPEYRLPRGVIEREVSIIEKMGVEILTNYKLDDKNNIEKLREKGFEAFFIGVGAMQGRDLNIPGNELDGVIKAVDYLLNMNRGYRVDLGKKVVVIGGGSVALDAARTAVREFYSPMEEIEMTAEAVVDQPTMDAARGALRSGAEEVHVISLESLAELPAAKTIQGKDELNEAVEEGIIFHHSWGPKIIKGNGKVSGIELVSCTKVFNDEGRFSPEFDETEKLILDADSIILSIGQQPDFSFLGKTDNIALTPAGTIQIDPDTLSTSAPGIYAGGDAAFGPRIAIEAEANGKKAARSIHEFLSGSKSEPELTVEIEKIPIDSYSMISEYEKLTRKAPESVDTGKRTGIAEVEYVYTKEEALEQAGRCLHCHIDTMYDPQKCVLCGRCADVCPQKCLHFTAIENVDMPEEQKDQAFKTYGFDDSSPLTVLLKDDTECIRCGLCAQRCPTEAMTMERFGFTESE